MADQAVNTEPANQDLRGVRTLVHLAQKVAKRLGCRDLLQRKMSQEQAAWQKKAAGKRALNLTAEPKTDSCQSSIWTR